MDGNGTSETGILLQKVATGAREYLSYHIEGCFAFFVDYFGH